LIRTGRGVKYSEGEKVHAFIEWLEQTYRPGLIGQPRDREEEPVSQCQPPSVKNCR
jgi:hypothetical protein